MATKRFTLPELEALPKLHRRNLINCLSGYKSICLCGTMNLEGQTNLSIISSIIHVGAQPPLIGMLMRPHVVERHTIENIDNTGYFTLNHITEDMVPAAHQTSARYPREVSEFDAVGLELEKREGFFAPYVAAAPLKIGLSFKEKHKITANATQFIIGRIEELVLPEEAIGEDGFIYLDKVGTITASGLDSYHRTERITRLSYAKPDQSPEQIP
ncbi:MAG: flavin reductase [Bacteroidota bacterium]